MASVDRHDLFEGLYAKLNVAGLQAGLGNPIRMYSRPPRTAVFPWCRVDAIASGYRFGVCGPNWIRQQLTQFTVMDRSTSVAGVAAIQKLIVDILDAATGSITVTNGVVIGIYPGREFLEFVEGTAYAVNEYTFVYQYQAA